MAVVALCLTVFGVVYAATDSNPTGASDSALNYHGRIRTVQMALTIDTGQRYQLNGTIDANIDSGRWRATVSVPLFFSTATVTAILANDHAYVTSPSVPASLGKQWLSVPFQTPDVIALASTLADFRTNLFCLNAIGPVKVTTSGPYTTYTVTGSVPKNTCFVPAIIASIPRVTVSVTLARKGQVASATIVAGVAPAQIRVHLEVLSYNSPVVIRVPPANQVQPLPAGALQRILSGQTPITKLLTPAGVKSLV